MKEVLRISILSSEWRYKWAMLPDLVFDELSFPVALYDCDKLVKIIDHVLFLHIGPIHKVKFSHSLLKYTSDVDRWIIHLSRKSMKEFSFKCSGLFQYKMHSCLFSCRDLIKLDLQTCSIKPPRTFKGFKSLKILQIVDVTLTQDAFENLIVCCPLLEDLSMKNWRGFTKVKIDAPNLRFLFVSGTFKDIDLLNTSMLGSIAIGLEARRQVPGNSSSLLKLFSQCAHVHSATLFLNFLKYLGVGDLPVKLPEPCVHLNRLHIDINFNDPKEVKTALCLLRSAPALQELDIKVREEGRGVGGEVNSWLDDKQNFQVRNLQTVKVHGMTSTQAVLDFIKFLLLNSPMLEKVFVEPASHYISAEILKRQIYLVPKDKSLYFFS